MQLALTTGAVPLNLQCAHDPVPARAGSNALAARVPVPEWITGDFLRDGTYRTTG